MMNMWIGPTSILTLFFFSTQLLAKEYKQAESGAYYRVDKISCPKTTGLVNGVEIVLPGIAMDGLAYMKYAKNLCAQKNNRPKEVWLVTYEDSFTQADYRQIGIPAPRKPPNAYMLDLVNPNNGVITDLYAHAKSVGSKVTITGHSFSTVALQLWLSAIADLDVENKKVFSDLKVNLVGTGDLRNPPRFYGSINKLRPALEVAARRKDAAVSGTGPMDNKLPFTTGDSLIGSVRANPTQILALSDTLNSIANNPDEYTRNLANISNLRSQGIEVDIYAGSFDLVCPQKGAEALAGALNARLVLYRGGHSDIALTGLPQIFPLGYEGVVKALIQCIMPY